MEVEPTLRSVCGGSFFVQIYPFGPGLQQLEIRELMAKPHRSSRIQLKYQEESDYEANEAYFRRENKDKVYSKWTLSENIAYAHFLRENIYEFSKEAGRRSLYFFNEMAITLDIGRNNQQCRSHHQKMEKKYKTVEAIIEHFLKQKVEKDARNSCETAEESCPSTLSPKLAEQVKEEQKIEGLESGYGEKELVLVQEMEACESMCSYFDFKQSNLDYLLF